MSDTFEVFCACCENTFDGIFENQAYGCASTFADGRLHGGFGSTVIDMQIWEFKNDLDFNNGDNICDECIKFFITENALKFVEGNVW